MRTVASICMILVMLIALGCADVAERSEIAEPKSNGVLDHKLGETIWLSDEYGYECTDDRAAELRLVGAPKNASVLPMGANWPSELNKGSWIVMVDEKGFPYINHLERFLNVAKRFPKVRFGFRFYDRDSGIDWLSPKPKWSPTGPLWIRVEEGKVIKALWDRMSEEQLAAWVTSTGVRQ